MRTDPNRPRVQQPAAARTTRLARCRICGAEGEMPHYDVAEMQFGSRERFRYFECFHCGCLQIAEFPTDIRRYYPPAYYSFSRGPPSHAGLYRLLRETRDRYAYSGRGHVGRILNRLFPYRFDGIREWLGVTRTTPTSRILDVGCGRGELLHDMANRGFRHLTGVDPFVESDIGYPNGVRVLRQTIHEVEGSFDLIMFHHSLEHIPDQRETLRSAARLLAPCGWCLVRIPTVSSFAWAHYREDWVQLDAPRHFFLHSLESFRLLAEQAGLRLQEVRYDSSEFQFVGSELYRQGLSFFEGKRFSRRQRARWRARARELNAQRAGDQAAFYLVRS